MYGSETAVSSTALAATGGALALGSWLLLAVGLIFAGVALYMLARRSKSARP